MLSSPSFFVRFIQGARGFATGSTLAGQTNKALLRTVGFSSFSSFSTSSSSSSVWNASNLMLSPGHISAGTPPAPAPASLIFMHGLGDTAQGWFTQFKGLQSFFPHVNLVFPTAPNLPITMAGGERMPAWYDIVGLSSRDLEHCEGIKKSDASIRALIQREIHAGIPASRIILAGFSQGGAMALYCGLQYEQQLAGLICASGYLPTPKKIPVNFTNLPVLICHGQADDVVSSPPTLVPSA